MDSKNELEERIEKLEKQVDIILAFLGKETECKIQMLNNQLSATCKDAALRAKNTFLYEN